MDDNQGNLVTFHCGGPLFTQRKLEAVHKARDAVTSDVPNALLCGNVYAMQVAAQQGSRDVTASRGLWTAPYISEQINLGREHDFCCFGASSNSLQGIVGLRRFRAPSPIPTPLLILSPFVTTCWSLREDEV